MWQRSARSAYQQAAWREPFNAFHYLELGKLSVQLGDVTGGEAAVAHAVEVEPNFLRAREWLAWRALSMGHRDIAIAQYDEIRRRKPQAAAAANEYERSLLQVDVARLAQALDQGAS